MTTEVSGDTNDEPHTAEWQRLSAGFGLIRQKRPPFLKKGDAESSVADVASPSFATPPPPEPRLRVQFLDPVSAGRASITSSSAGSKNNSPKAAAALEKTPTDLFGRIATILEKEYNNTVRQLVYQDVRSKAQNRIDQVKVSCHKMESVVLLEETPQSPTEWNKIPACHVYLVSCTTLEEYRQKIKPSIQAFVSQLTDQRQRPYLLVYCPTAAQGEDDAASTASTTASSSVNSVGNTLAQRPAARAGLALANRIRQRMNATASTSSTGDQDDAAGGPGSHDLSSSTSQGGDAAGGGDASWNRLAHLTRTERDIYRRLQADFGAANSCALAVPSLDPQSTGNLKKTEWSNFLQALASAMARGFQEQCEKYDEALRQMDAQRAKKASFDVAKFFLVKESWGFLYESFGLPAEALLQYKEVRVLLPDIRADEVQKVLLVEDDILSGIAGAETRATASDDAWSEMSQMVEQLNLDGFRRALADLQDLQPIAPAIEDYLYVRETNLLFQMADPVEVLLRSLAYVTAMVDFRLERCHDDKNECMAIEEWAFAFCWDLKDASRAYLPDSALAKLDATNRRPIVENFCRTLCDILGFARQRLLKLAKYKNTPGLVVPELSTDLQASWEPWRPLSVSQRSEPSSNGHNDNVPTDNGHNTSRSFLKDAFVSQESYQDCYLEVMKVAIAYNTVAGRHRSAARFRMEAVEIYVQRDQTHEAADTLFATAAVYDRDQWLACNFLLLFRLAGFQRRIAPPAVYLRTLFRCFSAGTKTVAPPKALDALQADLEAVVETDAVKGLSLDASPVFRPVLGLPDRNSRGTSDRKLIRKVYSVGDEARIVLRLTSFLCNTIDSVSLKIDLVPYQKHVLASEDGIELQKSDVVRVLSFDSDVTLSPGENQFGFSWIPLSSGQFVASSVRVEWKGMHFSYVAKELQRPIVRIDVLPAEADQSMTVSPSFLLPGHEQPLRIEFSPGLDEVEKGELQFACSPGLMLLPPGKDSDEHWVANGTVPLPSCPRGETVVLTASVKSVDSESADSSSPSVHVKISTEYRSFPAGASRTASQDNATGSLLTHEMDAEIPTLSSSSLTVKEVSLASHMIGRTLLGITLKCHTPDPFTLSKWKLELPSYLTLKEDVDLNAAIAGTTVKKGDVVHFSFLCECHLSDWKSSTATMVVDMQSKGGFMFHERLALRLRRTSLPRIELPSIQYVPIKVEASAAEGHMGSPIEINYIFDTTVFKEWKGDVTYEISMEDENWILSGSYRGLVDRSDDAVCKLHFTAVPVRPGLHQRYPELSIALEGNGLEKPVPLAIRMTENPTFKVQAPASQSTIVYPVFEV